MDRGSQEVTFLWYIENYSFFSREKGEYLHSLNFKPDGPEGNTWYLCLYPRGETDECKGFISFYLVRTLDNGPECVSVKFELSILAEDGSVLSSKEYDHSFERWQNHGSGDFLKMNESLYRRNFPRDILTVRCKMWKGEGEVHRMAPICIRTRIGVETISFRHEVDNFSTLKPNQKHTIRIPSSLKKHCFINSSFYFTHDSCRDGEMIVEITTSDNFYKLCKRSISLLGSSYIFSFREDDNRFDVERRDIRRLPLSSTRQEIVNNKSKYFPDDKLTLLCECSFYTGQEFDQIENVAYEIPFATAKRIKNQEFSENEGKTVENASAYPSLSEAIKSLYLNQSLTDVKLKTKTISFPAHKLVLCARSPVFERMMAIDMKEKNTDCVEVDDLGDDVVQQLLLFLYSDTVQDLEWAMATRLYYAADKYEVGRLKAVCSSFLVDHLTPTNAGELLLLADTHSDGDLKRVVEYFILEHEKEVFSSKEWEMLMETHPLLAMKAMHMKYKR